VCSLAVSLAVVVVPSSPVAAYTTIVYSGAGNAPRISVIGDSVVAAIRWTYSYAPLSRFNFTFDAESCRRTIFPSCGGREGYAPENTLTTMRRLEGSLGDVVVLMGGYDDPGGTAFAAGVDAVMAEAARQGIPKVIWLTLRTEDVVYVSPQYAGTAATFRANNQILLQKAAQYRDALQIADWATYSATHSSWVQPDGVHLSGIGASSAAAYIADMAERVLDGATITPPAVPAGYAPAAVSSSPGRMSVFAIGTDHGVYVNEFDGAAWSGFGQLGGYTSSGPAAVSSAPGVVDVFARGGDYALWTRHFDGATWGPWYSLGGVLRSAPAAVSGWSGTIDVFAVGADHALWTIDFDGINWGGWSTMGGIVTAPPAATSSWPGTLTVFAEGQDAALWVNAWNGGWSGWRSLGGRLTTGPAAASSTVDTIDVFARGGDNALWTMGYAGGWRGWASLGGILGGPPAATSPQPGTTAVFARGTDGALWWTVDAGNGFGGWAPIGGVLR
jgi:hypothetical protein